MQNSTAVLLLAVGADQSGLAVVLNGSAAAGQQLQSLFNQDAADLGTGIDEQIQVLGVLTGIGVVDDTGNNDTMDGLGNGPKPS